MSSRRFMLNIFIIVPRTFFHVSFRFSHKNDLMLIRSRFPHGYTYVLLVLPRGSQWLHFLISWSRKRIKDRVKINTCDGHKYTSKKKRFTRWLRVKTKRKNKIWISALCQYTYFLWYMRTADNDTMTQAFTFLQETKALSPQEYDF